MTSIGYDGSSLSDSNAAGFGIVIYRSLYHSTDSDWSEEIDSLSVLCISSQHLSVVPDFPGSLQHD